MFFNQESGYVLKAQLKSAVSVSQLKISVTYKDNTDNYHQDILTATNNTTAVTLLDEPSSGVVNIVELIKIYNPDTQANTVEILSNDEVFFTCTVGAGESAILSAEGVSNALSYTPANADLSNLTSTGKAKVSNLAMPSSTYTNLTLGASGSTYTAPADGYLFLSKASGYAYEYATLKNNSTSDLNVSAQVPSAGGSYSAYIPMKKNDVATYTYSLTGTTWAFKFIYAQGEV